MHASIYETYSVYWCSIDLWLIAGGGGGTSDLEYISILVYLHSGVVGVCYTWVDWGAGYI